MTILITGSTGFLGTAVVERLLARRVGRVRCFARPSSPIDRLERLAVAGEPGRMDVVVGNLQSSADVDRALDGVDVVVHAAGAKCGTPAGIFLDTVVASQRLVEALVAHRVKRLVLVSSLSVYGLADAPVDRLVDESTALEPHPERRDVYAHAKLRQELLVRDHAERYGVELIVLRPGPLYGGDGPDFPARVGLALQGWLLLMGGGHLLPLSYIDNCAEAVALAGTSPTVSGGAYNVVDDDLPTAVEYVRHDQREVRRVHCVRCPFFAAMLLSAWAERRHEASRGRIPRVLTPYRTASIWRGHRFDNRKMRGAGWQQVVPTREGLRRAFATLRSRHGVRLEAPHDGRPR